MNRIRSRRTSRRRTTRHHASHDTCRPRGERALYRFPDDVGMASPDLIRFWRGW